MLSISNNFELFVNEEKLIDLEKKHKDYEIFVYKDLVNNIFQVSYVPDTHKESDDDYANFEFLGSIIIPADPALELEYKKQEVLKHLYNKVDEIYSSLLSKYSVLEKESWSQQESEARALLAVQTPLIDSLCAVRGYSRDELAKKIVANAESAKIAGVSVLSWQQGLEEEIKKMSLDNFAMIWDQISAKVL